ncbi:MAG: transporter substrate-binding domain-containing protein [Deltaproteobacteria bacterium]|nr:transporter substrate-binding domain-containing protein [Deltaproteobacteria bacterium]
MMNSYRKQDKFEKTFRLAHINNFPPFAMIREGKSEGLSIEILEAVLSRVKTRVIFIPTELDKIQELLHTDQADGIAVFAITPDRRKIYDYSDCYMNTGAALFMKREKHPQYSLEDYSNKIICTPLKGPLTEFIERNFPEVLLRTVEDYPSALETVLKGKAEAAALNIHVGTSLINERYPKEFHVPNTYIFQNELAVSVLKGEKNAMLEKINDGLRQIREEGIYDNILKKWIHIDQTGL